MRRILVTFSFLFSALASFAQSEGCSPNVDMRITLDSMLLPVLLLIIVSGAKTIVAIDEKEIDVVDSIVDMAIDLLSVFSAFVIGRYLHESNTPAGLLTAFKVLALMAICLSVLCYFRRKVAKQREVQKQNWGKIIGFVVGEYVIDGFCLFAMARFL